MYCYYNDHAILKNQIFIAHPPPKKEGNVNYKMLSNCFE